MGAILEIYILSGVSYLIYVLFMGKDVSYSIKRWYLLAMMAASGIIPFIEIPVKISVAQEIHQALHYENAKVLARKEVMAWIYFIGAFLMGAAFVKQLLTIRKRLMKEVVNRYQYNGAEVVVCNHKRGDEFSFFKKIVISNDLAESEKELILAHEISHVKHQHTLEKIAIELLKVAMWFNPFVYIAAIHIEELQEYQADSDVLAAGIDKKEYVALIVDQVITSALPVSSKFYSYFTKSRFNKMLNPPLGKKGMAILSFVAAFCVMALFTVKANVYMKPVKIIMPEVISGNPDSLEQAGQMHTYTPDNEKFKNKIQSVPDPDEQVLMIPK